MRTANSVRKVIRTTTSLWFIAVKNKWSIASTGPHASVVINARRVGLRINGGNHWPGETHDAGGDIRKEAVGPGTLPGAIPHAGPGVLRQNTIRSASVAKTAIWLLLQLPVTESLQLVHISGAPGKLPGHNEDSADISGNGRIDTGDNFVDLESIERAIEPQAVLNSRAADIEMRLPEQPIGVAGESARFCCSVNVLANHRAVLIRLLNRPVILVAARLNVLDDIGTAGRHLDITSSANDANVVLAVVVEVKTGATTTLSRVHTFGHDPVLAGHAEALVAELLALVTTADIIGFHADAWSHRQDRPHISRGRDVLEIVGIKRCTDVTALDIDKR